MNHPMDDESREVVLDLLTEWCSERVCEDLEYHSGADAKVSCGYRVAARWCYPCQMRGLLGKTFHV